jgi:hypothetical protein
MKTWLELYQAHVCIYDTHKYKGSLKSLMGSITQIYSSTQGEQTRNISKTLAIETSVSTTHVYQYCQE